MVGKQLKTEQWKIINEFKTFNNYNIKCINERLGDLLSGSEDWEATIKAANKGTYKHIGAESSKVFILTFTKIFSQAKITHLRMDNIAALSYIAKMGAAPTTKFCQI